MLGPIRALLRLSRDSSLTGRAWPARLVEEAQPTLNRLPPFGLLWSGCATERDRPSFTSLPPWAQLSAIGYLAKISSVRLNALSMAACGVIPFLITSFIAMANTC